MNIYGQIVIRCYRCPKNISIQRDPSVKENFVEFCLPGIYCFRNRLQCQSSLIKMLVKVNVTDFRNEKLVVMLRFNRI